MSSDSVLCNRGNIVEGLSPLTFGEQAPFPASEYDAGNVAGSGRMIAMGDDSVFALGPGDSVSQVGPAQTSELVELCSKLLALGMSEGCVRDIAVACSGSYSEVSSAMSQVLNASLVASTVSARSQRRSEYLARVDSLAMKDGFCYLWLCRGSKRAQVADMLGPTPALSQLRSLPSAFLATREWGKVRIKQTGVNTYHLWWGPAGGTEEGFPFSDVVEATRRRFPGVLPETWSLSVEGPSPEAYALPVVARFGYQEGESVYADGVRYEVYVEEELVDDLEEVRRDGHYQFLAVSTRGSTRGTDFLKDVAPCDGYALVLPGKVVHVEEFTVAPSDVPVVLRLTKGVRYYAGLSGLSFSAVEDLGGYQELELIALQLRDKGVSRCIVCVEDGRVWKPSMTGRAVRCETPLKPDFGSCGIEDDVLGEIRLCLDSMYGVVVEGPYDTESGSTVSWGAVTWTFSGPNFMRVGLWDSSFDLVTLGSSRLLFSWQVPS